MITRISQPGKGRKFPVDNSEHERLLALRSYHILDTKKESEFDRFTKLASLLCGVPIAVISLLDDKRQWFKSTVGIDLQETSKENSFCQYTIAGDSLFEVEDASKDERFLKSPMVAGYPGIRFYAGCPLIDPQGFALGTICVLDYRPNQLSQAQKQALTILSQEVVSHIVLRKEKNESRNIEMLFNFSIDLVCLAGTDGYFKKVNPAFTSVLGWSESQLLERPFTSFVHPEDVQGTLAEISKLSLGVKTIRFVNRYRTKFGDYKFLEWVSNPDPLTGNIYAIARDITEKNIIKQQLFIAEKKFRALFEDSPDAIFLEDSNGTILDVNRAAVEIQELPKEILIGTNIRHLVPKEKYIKVLRSYKQLFLGLTKTLESSIWTPAGREVPVEISARRIFYENKSALLLHVRDISERKKLEAERAEIDKERMKRKEKLIRTSLVIREEERKRIASEMHDEIGSGLSKITFIAQVIKKANNDPALVSSSIEKILASSREVQVNINEIIWAMDPKNDTLENLLAYIHYYSSEYVEASHIDFHFHLTGKIPHITLNGKIRRSVFLIVKEALNNILKHAKASHVEIGAGFENKMLTILIQDNGNGFDSVVISRFKNGLINMRKRSTELGGSLNITSKPGEGTFIELSVPVCQDDQHQLSLRNIK